MVKAALVGVLSGLALAAVAGGQETAPASHFHHVHLNAVDPPRAIDFYAKAFDSEKAKFLSRTDAVWANTSWLLFTKVDAPPPWEPVSAIWHIGWGAEDMKAEYQKQVDRGTKFFTPLTDISDLTRTPGFFYAYVEGPDRALIELNTASHHHFGHVHLFSEDPVAAAEWYMKHLGATRRSTLPLSREVRTYKGLQVGPAASLFVDDVNVIIFPAQHSRQAYPEYWKEGQTALAPTKGRVIDHLGFSFDNLAEAVDRMKQDGVKVTEDVHAVASGALKIAYVEGPDQTRIELVEGRAAKQ
jgi:catechol 2,3-dioxygenase-like lactoylglutathione lyase family enzyme